MDFRFECHDRRLRMRTIAPEHARIIVADDLFQIGIEEEYFLSDAQTLQVPSRTPDAFFKAPISALRGTLAENFSRHRSRSRPSRITRLVTANWS